MYQLLGSKYNNISYIFKTVMLYFQFNKLTEIQQRSHLIFKCLKKLYDRISQFMICIEGLARKVSDTGTQCLCRNCTTEEN